MKSKTRVERDSLGELEVPAEALWGAQTQRAVDNFRFSRHRMPRGFLRALGWIKAAAAETNHELGLLPAKTASAIARAALDVAAGHHDDQFPIDVFQTGSGTSSNMNANEVIAHLATKTAGAPVHPNDHVNLGQSSNDVVPSAILIAAHFEVERELAPALRELKKIIDRRARELSGVTKTGRTHLMDAMPLTFGQELSAWSAQIGDVLARLEEGATRRRRLPLGGTAVGTGINADPRFAPRAIARSSKTSGVRFEQAPNLFAGLASPDAALELAGTVNGLAAVLYKISNDLRWMNSGPLAGLGEIELRALQPGSSIMPGKVNPVIPEAVAMIAVHVMGLTSALTFATASGNFQLNVMLPLVAHDLLESLELSTRAARELGERAIATLRVREDRVALALAKNPILVTALNSRIGYERAAALAKKAYAEGRPILDVALESTELDRAELEALLDPTHLTRGGAPTTKARAGKGKAAKAQTAKKPLPTKPTAAKKRSSTKR